MHRLTSTVGISVLPALARQPKAEGGEGVNLPVSALVDAAPNFLTNLDEAHAFFVLQDADTADVRLRALKADLRDMVAILSWSPGRGRPVPVCVTVRRSTRKSGLRPPT